MVDNSESNDALKNELPLNNPSKKLQDKEKVEKATINPLMYGEEDAKSKMGMLLQQFSYQGPFPPPQMMEQYEKLVPGIANRIFEIGFDQSKHRMELEKTNLDHNMRNSSRGQIFGFILGLVGLIGGTTCILFGYSLAGSSLGSASLVALVSVFLKAQSAQKQELDNKKPKKPKTT